MRLVCECGNRSGSVACSENQYSRVTTAMLATRMLDMQAGSTLSFNVSNPVTSLNKCVGGGGIKGTIVQENTEF